MICQNATIVCKSLLLPIHPQHYCDAASLLLQAKERIEMAKIRVMELEAQNKRDELKIKRDELELRKKELSLKLNNGKHV